MTPEIREVRDEVAALTLRVARPLIWHDRTEGWPKRLDGATCFFLRFEHGVIGVTADHVISSYERAVAANPNTVCQLRTSQPFDLAAATIARNTTRDIATFTVSEAILSQTEAVALDCRGSWPPPDLKHGWRLSLCGFPEASSMRKTWADRSAEFNAWGALTAVDGVTSSEIVTTYDPTIVEPSSWAPNLPPLAFNLSGCSGGPVLAHGIRNGLHRWFPVAIISGGPWLEDDGRSKTQESHGALAGIDLIRLSRIDIIQPDGTIRQSTEDTGWLPG